MYDARQINAPGRYAVDTRSDTVTRPDAAMRAAMAEAEVGDDVYGEDPSINHLEVRAAELLGKDTALFSPTATMSNLAAMLAHCARGEEVVTGTGYHVFAWEARGASVLGGLAMTPVPVAVDGALEAEDVARAVKPDDYHMPVTRLLSLENTHDGRAIPMDRTQAATEAARAANLATHLDGARFFNACEALGVTPATLATPFDTVQLCLSKGLGAPAGSLLVGASDVIARARRLRKMLGGGMRQAGVIAAAGLHALDHNLPALADDHARAESLAREIETIGLGTARAATNMVWADFGEAAPRVARAMAEANIALKTIGHARIVLHRDIDDDAFDLLLKTLRAA